MQITLVMLIVLEVFYVSMYSWFVSTTKKEEKKDHMAPFHNIHC